MDAAQRLRFLIDFSYSTGLRAGELMHATLGSIEVDAHGDQWLHVLGKGSMAGKVVLPGLAEKLRRATPHWMRHTHATHALQRGAELTTLRDKLRHASLSTTSMVLHSDHLRQAKPIGGAFAAPAA